MPRRRGTGACGSSGYFTYSAILFLLALLARSALAAGFATELEAVRASQAESRQVQESIDTLLGTDRDATRRRLRSLEAEIAALAREARELEGELARRRQDIEQLRFAGSDLRDIAADIAANAESSLLSLPPVLSGIERDAIRRSAISAAGVDASAAGDLATALSFATAVLELAGSTNRTTTVIELADEPAPRRVTLLRFGLVASYYLADDASSCGLWQEDAFVGLPPEDCTVLANVAKNVPGNRDVLRLPLPTAQAATP